MSLKVGDDKLAVTCNQRNDALITYGENRGRKPPFSPRKLKSVGGDDSKVPTMISESPESS